MSTNLYCTNCNKEFHEYEEVTEVRGGCVEPFLLDYVISSNDGPNYQTLCKDCACDLQVKPQPNRVVIEKAVLSHRQAKIRARILDLWAQTLRTLEVEMYPEATHVDDLVEWLEAIARALTP